jgi:hypothetical protein
MRVKRDVAPEELWRIINWRNGRFRQGDCTHP